ncbi:MAG: hypothetical protein WED09_10855 [Homoserinimonas sp.]
MAPGDSSFTGALAEQHPGCRSGYVDLLLDGWLVIELDGDESHDQVINGWAGVEATVRELLRHPGRWAH